MNVIPLTIAAAVFVGTFTTGGNVHAGTKAKPAPVKVASAKAKKAAVVSAAVPVAKAKKAQSVRSKLPREWVWKKYAKNFDSMFRSKERAAR